MKLIDFSEPQPYVKRALRYVPEGQVLDLGTGNGRNAIFFASHGFTVAAIDHNETELATLRTRCDQLGLPIQLWHEDVRSWHQPTGTRYAAIICTMVLHFLENIGEVEAVIAKMKLATKEGGVNVVSVYTNRNAPGTRPMLMPPHRLASFYDEWDRIETYEGPGRWYRKGASMNATRDFVERVIARKPEA